MNFSHVKHAIKLYFYANMTLKQSVRHQESDPDVGFTKLPWFNKSSVDSAAGWKSTTKTVENW